jgi:enterochelin esterase family protein
MSDVARTALSAIVFSSLGCSSTPSVSSSTPEAGAGTIIDTPAPGVDAGTDASPAADAEVPARCDRKAQAKTASTRLWDEFLQHKDETRLLADIAAGGGTPLEDDGDRLIFVSTDADQVAGSFSDWKPVAMQKMGGLFYYEAKLARGTAHTYKVIASGAWKEDPLAVNVVWDGINRGTVGEMNAIAHASDGDEKKGRMVAMRGVQAQKLGDRRDVFVYLPAKYDDGSCAKLPEIYVHDGNESLTRGDFAGAADAHYAARPAESAVLVFVALPDQNVRMAQYTFATGGAKGDDYGDFLVNELAPKIAANFHVCNKTSARGISGASLGGLISTYLAFQRPDFWGYVGAQSSSYFWANDAMLTQAESTAKIPVRFYLDHGCPGDNCEENREMNQILTGKGYEVLHVEENGAKHDWAYWRARLPKMLEYFRQGKTGCD